MPDYGHELAFGTFITPQATSPHDVVALARLTERVGLDLATFQDHPYQPAFLDTWTLLAWVAARTETVHLAPNVLNVPLRPPAVVARSVASLDRLSGGRIELALGAGAFWEGIEAMGGRRLTPGQAVDALGEAIDVIRELWKVEERGGVRVEGEHHRVVGAKRGPPPAHDVPIWVGAYKPRMLRLTGRKADGWVPSLGYISPEELGPANRILDEGAAEAGRDPRDVRRLLNVHGAFATADRGFLQGPPAQWVEQLLPLVLEHGVSTFILMGDDARTVEVYAAEVVPDLRERVAAERSGAAPPSARGRVPGGAEVGASEYERLGVAPTPDDGTRVSATRPWDESTRPHRRPSGPEVAYSDRGRLVAQHLIDVHDALRAELSELRDLLAKVREGAITAGEARSALNEMALRQNDWTLGAFCSRYCTIVAQHHGLEDDAIFPHLVRSDSELEPVIGRLTDEHLVIHDAIQAVDTALVDHIAHPESFDRIQGAIDFLADALLSHLSYEELEIVEPLARLGFYHGQV